MKLSFKNKLLMALANVCDEGIKKGGIPKHITIQIDLARELLEEISYLREEDRMGRLKDNTNILSTIKITSTDKLENFDDPSHPTFLIKHFQRHTESVPKQTYDALMDFWLEGKISVVYTYNTHHIPLIVDNTPKPSRTEWVK